MNHDQSKPLPREWVASTILATLIGFTVGYCTPAHADPRFCTTYRCSDAALLHDLRADERRREREYDRREHERETQRQLERSTDTIERQWEEMRRRDERAEDRRSRGW
jgi:hypothetical protein